MTQMSRSTIAALAGITGFLVYLVLVLLAADHLRQAHWLVEFAFFAAAGVIWVWPAKALIAWAVR